MNSVSCRAGEEVAEVAERESAASEFDAFYVGTATRITRQLILLTGDRLEAEDVTQEAFERAWLRWSSIRDCSSPEAWVRTVAQRLAISRWRRVRNAATAWRRHGPAANLPELDGQHVALMAALGRLPLQQRRAVVLYHLVDLTVEEVAAETGSSVAAVKKQLERGREALAALLGDTDPEVSPVRTVQP